MQRQNGHSDTGFTLIELLIVVATLGVIMTLGVQWYNLYKKRAWDVHTTYKLSEIRRAFENGRLETPLSDPPRFFWLWTTSPGPMHDGDGPAFLPGLVNEPDMQISANRNDWCDSGWAGEWCMIEMAWVRHCKGGKQKGYWRTRGGLEWTWDFDVNWPC